MQYSTVLSGGMLALACLASTLWLRPAFRWRTVQRALLLGFGLPLSAALCGVVRYGLDPDWSTWHRTFSQLSSYLGLPLLGLAAVSLQDVASAAGVSKSAVLKHFQSKEALQIELVDAMIERFTEAVWRPAEPLPGGRERLDRIFQGELDWIDGEDRPGGCRT